MRVGMVVCPFNHQIFPYYLDNVLKSLSTQIFDGTLDVVVSANKCNEEFLNTLDEKCREYSNDTVSFSYIEEPEHDSLFSSFNLGLHVLRQRGKYGFYGYSADDDWFKNSDGVAAAVRQFADKSIAIVSSQIDRDNCAGNLEHYVVGDNENMKIELSESVNLHAMFFSEEYMEAYDYRYPDMLLAAGTESLLTFFCAAIGKIWILCGSSQLVNVKQKGVRLPNKKWGFKSTRVWTKTWREKQLSRYVGIEELIRPGVESGMGYKSFVLRLPKESRTGYPQCPLIDYDHSLYDDNGRCKNPEALHAYIKEYLFIPESECNYAERLTKARTSWINWE